MKQRGISILEISMGLAVLLPLLFHIFLISGYLLTLYDISRITQQLPKELSARAVTLSQSAQSSNIDDGFGNYNNGSGINAYRTKLKSLSERISKQIYDSHIPDGTKYCVTVGALPIEIDNSTGAAMKKYRSADGLRPDLSIEMIKYETTCSPLSMNISSNVERNLTTTFSPLIDEIRLNRHAIPSPFAIPSGLRGVQHQSYLGKSQLFTEGYTATASQHTKTSTSFFERTMVLGISFGFDFSETKNGKSLRYFTESSTSQRFKKFLLPRDFYATSLAYPRSEL